MLSRNKAVCVASPSYMGGGGGQQPQAQKWCPGGGAPDPSKSQMRNGSLGCLLRFFPISLKVSKVAKVRGCGGKSLHGADMMTGCLARSTVTFPKDQAFKLSHGITATALTRHGIHLNEGTSGSY